MNIEDVLRSHGVGVGSGGGGGNGVIVTYRNTVTLASAGSAVPLGFSTYNKSKDSLFVYQNNVYKENLADYTISSDGTSINKTSGTWAAGTTFYFVVLSSAPASEAMINASIPSSVTITANGTVSIPVGVADFDATNDVLDVYHQNTMYYPTTNYTISGTGASATINLVGFSLDAGQVLFLRIWKRVRKDLSLIASLYTTVSPHNLVTLGATGGATVNIGIGGYVPTTDLLHVFKNGDILYPATNYTVDSSGSFINLVGFTGTTGDNFYFEVIKQVLTTMPTYQANSVTNAMLDLDTKHGSNAALTTVAKTDTVAAINELDKKIKTMQNMITMGGLF
jgi:hypothetical protein